MRRTLVEVPGGAPRAWRARREGRRDVRRERGFRPRLVVVQGGRGAHGRLAQGMRLSRSRRRRRRQVAAGMTLVGLALSGSAVATWVIATWLGS